jgi:hypothetical protein
MPVKQFGNINGIKGTLDCFLKKVWINLFYVEFGLFRKGLRSSLPALKFHICVGYCSNIPSEYQSTPKPTPKNKALARTDV